MLLEEGCWSDREFGQSRSIVNRDRGFGVPTRRVIYDFGANNGDDLPYYLKKVDLVVAVEANPALCQRMRARFAAEIDAGRIVVDNYAVTVEESGDLVCDFYRHRQHDVLGQFPEPEGDRLAEFERIVVPRWSIARCIETHGDPYYVKIDVQCYETALLRALLTQGVRPPFVSAELQGVETLALLAADGHYDAFKLVDGATVSEIYGKCRIAVGDRFERYSFPVHSAGPFGDDIEGPWMTAEACLKVIAREGLHWKDVHATRRGGASHVPYPSPMRSAMRRGIRLVRQLICR
jgi:FkbM family methyltransferase